MGWNFNLTTKWVEIWKDLGGKDLLANLFLQKIEKAWLVDVALITISPTQINIIIGEEKISKRIDIFLVFEYV